MRLTLYFLLFSLISVSSLIAQNDIASTSGDNLERPIVLRNPSFEDFPRLDKTPNGWYDCGFSGETSVDIHPVDGSAFKVTAEAYDGKTYLGMVVRENDTWESVGQRLPRPLKAGNCYEFSAHIARSPLYMSVGRSVNNLNQEANYATPAKLRIWGGNGYCGKVELLAESATIINTRWLEFNFRFEPKYDLTYISFEVFYKTPSPFPYNGNIILDNLQPIIPVPCDAEDIPIAEAVPTPNTPDTPSKPKAEKPEPVVKNTPPTTVNETQPKQREAEIQGNKKSDLRIGQVIALKNLQFDADSIVIPPRSYEAMNELYDFLAENPDLKIEIGGHTNGQPAHAYCDKISQARAKSAADFLLQRGISKDRLTWKGYGKRKPIMSNKTAYGRRQNQRVEVKIMGFK